MSRKRAVVITAIAVACLVAVILLDQLAPFFYIRTRNLLRDAITRAGRTTPANPDLIFLAIDAESVRSVAEEEIAEIYGPFEENSVEERGLRLMKKQWPWSREAYALLLERLLQAGAKVVIFDLTFPTPLAGDDAFRAALDKYRDRVVIGSNFVSSDQAEGAADIASDTQPTDTLITPSKPRDDRVAFTNFWPDEDDVVRRAQYQVTADEVKGRSPLADSERFLSLDARALVKAGLSNCVPSDTTNRLIRFTAPPREGFPPRPLIEVFDPHSWHHRYKSGEFFRDKIVLVGAEGNWQHDDHATPLGLMPGPELHLNAINAAIHGAFIREFPGAIVLLAALVAAAIAIVLSLGVPSPWLRLLLLLLVDLANVWGALVAFNEASVYVPCLPFLLVLNSTVLLGFVCDFTWERLEKTRVRRTLEKYVSTNVVRELLDNPKAFQQSLGGVLKPATILFSDIRGYSSVSAKTDPEALVSQLNEYLSAMVECVFRHGGTLDKFIGDAVMAVWGNMRSDGLRADATNAICAALEMRTELARLNRDWQKRGLPEFRAGIAVNQGDVVVGNIGSTRRMEFTVVGDVVNTCWKLQELTKQFDADLIVSRHVSALLVEDFELQSLGEAAIAGHDVAVEVFSVLGHISVTSESPAR